MFNTTTTNLRAGRLVKAAFLFTVACFAPLAASAQTPTPTPKPCFDFTGSGRTSFATINRDTDAITWRILGNGGSTAGSLQTISFGLSSDIPTPGYFDNDSRADLGVYRQSVASYFVRPSTSTTANSFRGVQFGISTDVPGREADYDGDGIDDFTVVRDTGTSLTWFILRSNNNTFSAVSFGFSGFTNNNGDLPIAGADYNGDGRADITVIRRAANGSATYFAGDSTTGALVAAQQWGNFDTDFFVVGDYLGDRRADFAVYRAFQGGINGTWFVQENGGTGRVIRPFGFTSFASVTDRPICGDYNGDGKQDIAIYRSSNSSFFWLNSPDFNTFSGIQFGQAGEFPVAGLRAF